MERDLIENFGDYDSNGFLEEFISFIIIFNLR